MLIHWYFERILGFNQTEIEEVSCDGGQDLGIDVIWIDESEDAEIVHFYQFKNPADQEKGIAGGDVDKVISGLELILSRKHATVSNAALKARIEEIYKCTPNGYRLHFISSGQGLPHESTVKLDAFVQRQKAPAGFIVWDQEPLEKIHDKFYQRTLPAIHDPIRFTLPDMPYMVSSAGAGSYFFHVPGTELASLYAKYGEGLLQRNIRVWQRETATNRAIQATCSGPDSANFLHYNNGITFICEKGTWDQFVKVLTLDKAQVVNGGQTIRALSRAAQEGSLRSDVIVPVRAIESKGDKEFASNVAINQNNQNQLGTGFLRSNDPGIVQLGHALESRGWYLERREGELNTLTETEKAAILKRIGKPQSHTLESWTIRLKEGIQAYVATFYEQPELAKKNVKKIFLSTGDGGSFERIFCEELTADKIVIAHQIKQHVDEFVWDFLNCKSRK